MRLTFMFEGSGLNQSGLYSGFMSIISPDYRWLLDRDDSPWYPTAKLFRQNESRDYATVLGRVRDELEAQIAAFRPELLGREHSTAVGSASSPGAQFGCDPEKACPAL
jgi:hypothetical protein